MKEHIKNVVAQLPGFIEVTANHTIGKTIVKFDKSKSTFEQVIEAINETGYKVAKHTETKN